MTRGELQDIRRAAFAEASQYLLTTAADFAEMAGRVEIPPPTALNPNGRVTALTERRTLLEKAALLTGQAGHIKKIQP